MQGFNMGRYHPPAALDRSLSAKRVGGFNEGTNRAQKPTVRFEMPFDIWCTTCQPEAGIPQGVRFNAQKETVGRYYSTPIYSFRIKHGACGGIIEIRTDPENREYAVYEGGRRKAVARQEKDGPFGAILTDEERAKRQEDAFAHIEGRKLGQEAEQSANDEIKMLRRERAKFWHEPYTTNANLRRTFRSQRKAAEADEKDRLSLSERYSLGIEVVSKTKSDKEIAGQMRFGDPKQAEKDRFWAVNRPLFPKATDPTFTTSDSHDKMKSGNNKDSAQRELFHKMKRTVRLQSNPWSEFYVPKVKSDTGQPTGKRKIETCSSPPPSKKIETVEHEVEGQRQSRPQERAPLNLVSYGSESDD